MQSWTDYYRAFLKGLKNDATHGNIDMWETTMNSWEVKMLIDFILEAEKFRVNIMDKIGRECCW